MCRCKQLSRVIPWLCIAGLLFFATATPSVARADEPAATEKKAPHRKWVRLKRTSAGEPLSLQTAVVRYTAADGPNKGRAIDLIGAIHVGDRVYYQQLNRQFKGYDVLLYELVAAKETRLEPDRDASSRHPVGAMQFAFKDLLELEHQLQWIDYTKDNFVHADMTPEQFSKSMSQRGESFVQIFFRLLGTALAQQSKEQAEGKSTDLELLMALFDKNRALRLKQLMAAQLEDMETLLVGFGGPQGSTLITQRNKVALDVLAKQLKAGKQRIGIFYGAGHMADMDKRLREEYGLVPGPTRWIDAWDLRGKKD